MKKILLYFLFLVLPFSFINAQDTLLFNSGKKVGVHVLYVGKRVFFTIPPKERRKDIKLHRLYYIKYADGSIAYSKTIQKRLDSIYIINNPDHRPISVNAGIGASFMELAVPGNNLIGGGGPTFLTESPAYNCTIDYNFIRKLSIGIGGAYQWVTDKPGYGQSETAYWETEKISRYNISGRLLVYLIEENKQDLYMGIRAGTSIWTDQIISNTHTNPYIIWETMSQPYLQRGSFQVLFGYRILVSTNLGFHFEAGIGTPYLIEAGITFRFNTR